MDYDWDSVQVGRPELNSSQNFFNYLHVLHEKEGLTKSKNNRVLNQQNSQAPKQQQKEEKKTVNNEVLEGVVVTKAKKENGKQSQTGKGKENVSGEQKQQPKKAIVAVSRIPNPDVSTKTSMLRKHFQKSLTIATADKSTTFFNAKKAVKSDFRKMDDTKSSQQRPVAIRKSISTEALGNRLFEYAEIAKKNRETLTMKFKQEQEKEYKYTFHAQPVPKFKKSLSIIQKQPSMETKKIHKQISLPQIVTKPTRETLVPSCGDPDRIRGLHERKKSLVAKYTEPQVNFRAKPAKVLKKQPFQPVYNTMKAPESKPFKLHLSERLVQRQEFNKKNLESVANRRMQEETKKRQVEMENVKLIRQKTEFKARANPFRNAH